MGKYEWHIARKGETPKVIRHYRHLTFMYKFIARNPATFGDRTLTVFNHGNAVVDITWNEVVEIVKNELNEKPARKLLFEKKLLEERK